MPGADWINYRLYQPSAESVRTLAPGCRADGSCHRVNGWRYGHKTGAILIWQQTVKLPAIAALSLIISPVNAYSWAYLSLKWTFCDMIIAVHERIFGTQTSHIPYYWHLRRDRIGWEVLFDSDFTNSFRYYFSCPSPTDFITWPTDPGLMHGYEFIPNTNSWFNYLPIR